MGNGPGSQQIRRHGAVKLHNTVILGNFDLGYAEGMRRALTDTIRVLTLEEIDRLQRQIGDHRRNRALFLLLRRPPIARHRRCLH